MPKPNKIRLTLHTNSLVSLAGQRSILFTHPSLDCDIELCLGADIGRLEVCIVDSNMFSTDIMDIRKLD